MEEEFKISKNLLKSLTVDTRVDILKSLENRPMTASELSRSLGKHVTTVSEHLNLLKNSDLIERIERPGRKWIYYKLTRSGKQVLHPRPYKLVFMFSIVIFCIIGAWGVLSVDAYPNQFLYGLDRSVESLQLSLITGNIGRAKKHLEFAEERLAEAKVIAEKGETKIFKETINDYKREIENVRKSIEIAKSKGENVVPALEELSESMAKQKSILKNIIAKKPELAKETIPALNVSEEEHTTAAEELHEITGIAYPVE